jgi:DNA gyrase subunit A
MTAPTSPTPTPSTERIVDVELTDEMEGSFLEYAYSVIYSRALPDARDGLKACPATHHLPDGPNGTLP